MSRSACLGPDAIGRLDRLWLDAAKALRRVPPGAEHDEERTLLQASVDSAARLIELDRADRHANDEYLNEFKSAEARWGLRPCPACNGASLRRLGCDLCSRCERPVWRSICDAQWAEAKARRAMRRAGECQPLISNAEAKALADAIGPDPIAFAARVRAEVALIKAEKASEAEP